MPKKKPTSPVVYSPKGALQLAGRLTAALSLYLGARVRQSAERLSKLVEARDAYDRYIAEWRADGGGYDEPGDEDPKDRDSDYRAELVGELRSVIELARKEAYHTAADYLSALADDLDPANDEPSDD